ncbi:MAG: AAA family ATPase [Planctomycetota bacterium]|nr:MAG: AAA family ATPase [Planctomycetota bacterium]
MDIFDSAVDQMSRSPLAARMRPKNLDDFAGQQHILGPGRLLRRAIEADQLTSLIFYGPPGTGKTTLARIIAETTRSVFLSMNAVLSGVKDIKNAIQRAEELFKYEEKRSILFIDEVHRFNKSQQDALLPHVENGTIVLIGATTENPYFEVNKALVSRSRIFQLKSLSDNDLLWLAKKAIADKDVGYGKLILQVDENAYGHLVKTCNGDARSLLNALELAVTSTEGDAKGLIHITVSVAEESIQKKAILYDKDGDAHYDTISAFIKSLRGSDPDAALYWMAKMIYAGEDPKFIFRRMIILAAEDVGLADPNALTVVMSASQAYDYVGLPEGQFHLSQAALYLSTCPKSNSTLSYFDALSSVKDEPVGDIPNPLKDSSRDKEGFGHGAGYKYPHAYHDHWVAQQYLPTVLQGKKFYHPGDLGYEGKAKETLERRREVQLASILEDTENKTLVYHWNENNLNQENQWIKRSHGNSVHFLEKIRDEIFHQLDLQPDDLSLDLNFGSGLLTWELARKVLHEGVYSILLDKNQQEIYTSAIADKSRIDHLVTLLKSSDHLSSHFDEKQFLGIQFDKVIGFKVFMKWNRETFAKDLIQLCPQGRIVLIEIIPKLMQRPLEYVDLSGFSNEMRQKIIDAENNLFDDSNEPTINWNQETIVDLFLNLDSKVNCELITNTEEIVFNQAVLDRLWSKGKNDALTYFDKLSKYLDKKEIELLRDTFISQNKGQKKKWKTAYCLFTIHTGVNASK